MRIDIWTGKYPPHIVARRIRPPESDLMLQYDNLKNWDFGARRHHYGEKDTILYALAAGMGTDPTSERELGFVYEASLKAMPSMATILGSPGMWWRDPRTGVDYGQNLHAEQDMHILVPIPASAEINAVNRVAALHDRGRERGVLARIERDIFEAGTGRLLARLSRIEVLRGAGGFSEVVGKDDPRPEHLPRLPEDPGPPDVVHDIFVPFQAGLLYRLCGDPNPLHADPETARKAGFARPILHGLGTFAFACTVLLRTVCQYRSERVSRMGTRFTSPVYPGETLRALIWRKDPGIIRFRIRALERDVTVLDNGLLELSTSEDP